MAAGQGFKTFTTGEVLSAADVNGYLMQGVLVFANSAERDSEITSPQEGQFAYLKDTNVTTYYTGSAWANLDTTGMTNPMTTTGDTIYSSSGSTPARLGIGTTGQVLTVSGGVPTWATPSGAADNFQLINAGGTALTGATTVTVSGISGKNRLYINIANASSVNASPTIGIRLNTDSGANYSVVAFYNTAGSTTGSLQANGGTSLDMGDIGNNATNYLSAWILIDGTNAAGYKPINFSSNTSGGVTNQSRTGNAVYMGTSAISSISVISSSGNLDAGTIYVYGA